MAQGIPFDKGKVLEALSPYFKLGYGIPKACKLAGFNDEVLYDWISKDPSLLVKIEAWQNEISVLARSEWKDAIVNGRPTANGMDRYTPSKEWLERVERKEFSTRTEADITSKDKEVSAGIFVTDFKNGDNN